LNGALREMPMLPGNGEIGVYETVHIHGSSTVT
jgi:hypothetical protein